MKISPTNSPNGLGKRPFLFYLSSWLVFLLFVVSLAPAVLGQSPSPETTPTSQENLDEKIKDIREAVKEKVQEKLETVKQGQKRAFVGEIKDLSDSLITLIDRQGTKQIKVDEKAQIIDQNRKNITIKDLEAEKYVIAMGYLEETDVLNAIRIVVVDKLNPLSREAVFGKVTDLSEEKVLTIKNEKKNTTYTIEIIAKTKITKNIESKTETIGFADIKLDDYLISVGVPTENEEKIITANIIHVIPALPTGGSAGEPDQKPETTEPAPSPSPAEE